MNEFLNVLFAFLAGCVTGAALHSAYLHAREKGNWHIW